MWGEERRSGLASRGPVNHLRDEFFTTLSPRTWAGHTFTLQPVAGTLEWWMRWKSMVLHYKHRGLLSPQHPVTAPLQHKFHPGTEPPAIHPPEDQTQQSCSHSSQLSQDGVSCFAMGQREKRFGHYQGFCWLQTLDRQMDQRLIQFLGKENG